jgi:hypothetical protein
MTFKSKPINPDNLQEYLESSYSSFTDEMHRLIDIKLFQQLFVYKFANQLSGYTFWVELKKPHDEIHCDSICGMRFIFPLHK